MVIGVESQIASLTADLSGLAAGLAGLAGLVAGSGTLEQLLTDVAQFALLAMPGADGVGVTMLKAGQSDSIMASTSVVRDVDPIQYRLGEGPCISVAVDRRTAGSAASGEDTQWPALAAGLGIQSAMALPLVVDGEILGAIDVYAHARDAFTSSSRRLGEQFAGPAAVVIHNARLMDRAQRTVARLDDALMSRPAIDHMVGSARARAGDAARPIGCGVAG